MKKSKKQEDFIKTPHYPGGPKAIQQFVREHLVYPDDAKHQRIEGTVTVRYTINHEGVVIRCQILSGLGYGCDEEAQRLVGLLRFEVPSVRKVRVQYHRIIHIHFHLPKIPVEPNIKVEYQLTTVTSAEPPEKNPAGSYHYSIKLKR